MIAAVRRRFATVPKVAAMRTRQVDRALARRIERLRPRLVRLARRARAFCLRATRALGRRLRPVAVLVLRGFSRGERLLRRLAAWATRAATRAGAAITPSRAVAATIFASAAILLVAQFVTYSSVEIGQPAYAGLPAASAPTTGGERAGEAHAYVLVPLALAAAALALLAMRRERRGLGRIIFLIGLVSLAVTLIVDLPAGLDVGVQSSRFSGTTAVLEGGFYAELAAAVGLLAGGLLYYARPCRIRINLSGRAASARRRRRRRRGSSPRKGARRPSLRRRGGASAPASRP